MKGKLALCGKGTLGLITHDEPQLVVYRRCNFCTSSGRTHPLMVSAVGPQSCDCETGQAYVGVHLTDAIAPIGSPWSSRNPKFVGSLESGSAGFRVRGFAGTSADLRPEINAIPKAVNAPAL